MTCWMTVNDGLPAWLVGQQTDWMTGCLMQLILHFVALASQVSLDNNFQQMKLPQCDW